MLREVFFMQVLASLPLYGWISIIVICFMIFMVLMLKGIRLGWGDKSISIGKKLEDKIDSFKKEIEIETLKKEKDETLQKALFKKSGDLDRYVFASLIKAVKKLDNEVYKLFSPFIKCQFPSLTILDIFEDVLIERVNFNNIKEKLTGKMQNAYIEDIIQDIKTNYINFLVHLKTLHCGEHYPEWEKIEAGVKNIIRGWALKCVFAYIECVNKKIEMYKKAIKKFQTKEFKKNACIIPYNKNKKYLEELNNSCNILKEGGA